MLKDHRPDTAKPAYLFETLPELCDSFFSKLKYEDATTINAFIPEKNYLKATFDTLDIEYNETRLTVRHQNLAFNLQKQYKKLLKKAAKQKLKLKHLEKQKVDYEYGKDEKENEFCYVTFYCNKRKTEYEIKFVAIRLIDKWFIGDELSFTELP
ncbi:MAG: hypothetical protein RLZZ337_974 [Bacteroidota bacterium]